MACELGVDGGVGRGVHGHPGDVLVPETVAGKGNEIAVTGLN